jgi:DNA-binding CsgD family transcriptional regulator
VKVVDSMMRLTEREQERVWELRAEGHSSRAIGRELGLRQQYVSLCVALTGGVRPPVRKRSQRWLTKTEREEISRGLARGDGFREIAVQISRSHTAVSREVNRNGGRARYRAQHAEAAAWDRARRPKPSKLALNSTLRALVEEKLELRWSPQQISRWLRRTYGDDEAMGVSHETIYLSLLSVQGLVCQARRRRVGGEWLRVVERGSSCARAPRLISVLDLTVGDMMVMGCCSRWGKCCGRSVFGGCPPGGVGSDMPGAGRDVSV